MDDILRDVLTRVRAGTSEFAPASDSLEDLNQFQQSANALVQAKDAGLVRDCFAHMNATTGRRLYDRILVGGLTHAGTIAMGKESESSTGSRLKSEKFGILDAPRLLNHDLDDTSRHGILGQAVLYIDLDHFKELNTRYLESVVDRDLLPPLQRLLDRAVAGHGFAYQEGGDEFAVFLPNATLGMALAFGEALRDLIEGTPFSIDGDQVQLTASIGVAASSNARDASQLKEASNEAKRHAKTEGGRNCVAYSDGTAFRVADRPNRSRITIIGGLNDIDSLVLKLACEHALATGNDFIDPAVAYKEDGEFAIASADLIDSEQVLEQKGLIEIAHTIGGGLQHFSITHDGLAAYVKSCIPNYQEILTDVVVAIVKKELVENIAIAEDISQPRLLVDHILDALEYGGHIKQSGETSQRRFIYNISPTLKRSLNS